MILVVDCCFYYGNSYCVFFVIIFVCVDVDFVYCVLYFLGKVGDRFYLELLFGFFDKGCN